MRQLDGDGITLRPVLASHPDESWTSAMQEAMLISQRADEGLWRSVMTDRRAVRWENDTAAIRADSNDVQASFLNRHPVRAIMGVPIMRDGCVTGGLGLVRFVAGRPYGDADEELAVAVAQRLAPLLDLIG